MRDVCDVAYCLQLAELERHYLVERQVIGAARVQGADVEIPSWVETRAGWDETLSAAPRPLSLSERRRRDLGVP